MINQQTVEEFVDSVPTANFLLRLPLIRHIRAAYAYYKIDKHYSFWNSAGYLPFRIYLDYAVVDAIRDGRK